MSAPTTEELELHVQSDDDDPRCELTIHCPIHGEEDCGGRARWVMSLICQNKGPEHTTATLLACDDCHDSFESGTRTIDLQGHRIEWRPL